MDSSTVAMVGSKPKRRFRVGIRGLLVVILLVGVGLGWFARQDRLAREQTARLMELRRVGVLVNDFEPTVLGLIGMRVFRSISSDDILRQNRWLDPGWFSRPTGFNAGMLPDDRVAAVVDRVGQFGDDVTEVRFDRPPLTGLRLFYVGRVPYDQLGVPRDACTFAEHLPAADPPRK